MSEAPTTEEWKGLRKIDNVFRSLALPEVYMENVAYEDERYFLNVAGTATSRPLWFSTSRNMWADIVRTRKGAIVNRHYHPGQVFGYTISGKWGYLEHDWTATTGDFVFESPGESHTLVTYDCDEPTRIFFIVEGPLIWLDEEGSQAGSFDVFDYIELTRQYYEQNGIGGSYVDQLIR